MRILYLHKSVRFLSQYIDLMLLNVHLIVFLE